MLVITYCIRLYLDIFGESIIGQVNIWAGNRLVIVFEENQVEVIHDVYF